MAQVRKKEVADGIANYQAANQPEPYPNTGGGN